jgi:exopolysaccharide biosynthesis protein
LPNALGFVNANFFTPEGLPIGLVTSDGAAFGASLVNRGGMFQVTGGVARVRSLIEEPYYGEALEQAVQAFPMLVVNRQPIYQQPWADRTSRRTVVAQDGAGRIVILVTPLLGMTLNEMATFLITDVELDIINALNLDGGGSTILVAPGGIELPSFDPVPVVLAFYAR